MAGVVKKHRKVMKMLVRELNKKLKMAWQVLEDETCKMCGTPSWFGRNPDNNVDFDERSSVCKGCDHLNRKSEERNKKKGHKHNPAITYYVTPKTVMKETKLPTRDQWLQGVSTLADLPEFAEMYGPKNKDVGKERW